MVNLVLLCLAVCLISSVHGQTILHCNRCFGNGYCNDVNHPDYAANIRNTTCSTPSMVDSDDPITNQINQAIQANVLNAGSDSSPLTFTQQGHCVTASVFENHDTHTLRTCVYWGLPTNSTVTLCEVLRDVIQPMNRNNGTFSCRQCNGTHFCNNLTLNIGDGISSSNVVSVGFIWMVAVMTLVKLV